MGLIDKIKGQGGEEEPGHGKRGDDDSKTDSGASGSANEALPGGASGEEAAAATPQRAAELAD